MESIQAESEPIDEEEDVPWVTFADAKLTVHF